jgi:hypothetical protein
MKQIQSSRDSKTQSVVDQKKDAGFNRAKSKSEASASCAGGTRRSLASIAKLRKTGYLLFKRCIHRVNNKNPIAAI